MSSGMTTRLSEADRERLGGPEWLDVDMNVLPVSEGITLEAATGLSVGEVIQRTRPKVEAVPGGRNVSFTAEGLRIRVWLGLHRAGIEVAYNELDFDLSTIGGVRFVPDADVEEPGKAPSSPTTLPSTPSTSRTSGRRTRSSKSPQ